MIGQKIGPFEIISLLGKGGMGEVYRAQDSQLNREVALKILPEDIGAQPDRLARFEREAKVLASLQHQNIAAIFGLEEFGGKPVLVMELAEGDELTDRIAAGNMTGGEIEKICRQLARGLEFAHENGVIHRDLKPANVKVFGDGQVKILDFGLARAMDPGAGSGESAGSDFVPTMTQGLTVAGTVLGTAAYMSPEQARGYDVDRRSDIWAFGVILFEMLTGHRLFEGKTATDTLAAILRQEPDWETIPDDASPLLVQICRRCLEKDPSNRLRDIGEVRVALDGSTSSVIGLSVVEGPALSSTSVPAQPSRLPWLVATLLAAALAVVSVLGFTGALGPDPAPQPLVHTSVSMPEGVQLNLNPAAPGPPAVSPDGSRLAFSATDSNGQVMLYVRDLDQRDARVINGTLGAHYPFWAPDNRTVGFFNSTNKLAKVDISGGPIVTICAADNGKGGTWNENDVILFASTHVSSISSVSASGGPVTDLTQLDQDTDFRSHRFPHWLPGGEAFFYLAVSRTGGAGILTSELRLGTLDNPAGKKLMPSTTNVVYSQGEAMFIHDSVLMSRPFDLEALEFSGPARPMMGGTLALPAAHLSLISASQNNILAYCSGREQGFGNSQLFMLDSRGQNETPLNEPLLTYGFDLSSDGKKLLLALPDRRNGTFDIWILEIERNLRTRFTFNPETELLPLWSGDGNWIYFASDRTGHAQIFRKRVSGTGVSELLFEDTGECYPASISKDGKTLVYSFTASSGDFGVGIYDLETQEKRQFHPPQGFSEVFPSLSPDSQWMAFSTSETGQMEVFVESMEPGGGRYRVSSNGGTGSQWSADGQFLFFLTSNGEIRSVAVDYLQGGGLSFGSEEILTNRVEYLDSGSFRSNQHNGSIIVMRSTQNGQNSLLGMVQNWQHLISKED